MIKNFFITKNLSFYAFFVLKFFMNCFNAFIFLYTILIKKDFINSLVYNATENSFNLLALIGVLTLFTYLTVYFNKLFDDKMKIIIKSELNKKIIDKTEKIDFYLLESKNVQDKLHNFETLADKIISISNIIIEISVVTLQTLGIIYLLMDLNILIILGILSFLAVSIYINLISGKKLYKFWSEYMKNIRKSNYYSEILSERSFYKEKNIFQYSDYINSKFDDEFEKAKKVNKKNGLKRFKIQLSFEFFSLVYSFCCFIILLKPLIENVITIGFYISIIEGLNKFFTQINKIILKLPELSEYKSYNNEYNLFINQNEYEFMEKKYIDEIYSIEFKDIWFKYPETDNYILKNCNFKIEKGKHYAFVGKNGEGKSTIIKLLFGLYKPNRGEIIINNKYNISEIDIFKITGSVLQDFTKFPLTIKEFINLGNNSNTIKEEELYNLFSLLNSESLLNKKSNFLTTLNENGINISGGEWQKLLLARLLFSNKELNILDEPTSNIDPITESRIYEFYNKQLKNKTSIFITHRLASTKNIDKIFVLKNGKIIEQGNHKELMNLEKEYFYMYSEQRRLYEKSK